ncbi:peroxisomal membrane protein 11B [Aricia agestis]|uniref:peroxisomal membrane protein 11B n=1 Tax=Aricia agestis TaxID=91739 RepID=UPI001C20A05E|nr:peroxisomal membrane protein 11B [Aricia agestis]
MDIIIKVNNQSNGRDKLARLIQYTSRLVWHQLESRHANKYSVDRIKSLENTFSTFRKVLRLGRCVDIFYIALNTMSIDDPIIRTSMTLSKVAHGLFLFADHIVWLTKSGFLKTDADSWNTTAYKFWLLSIIANLVRDVYEIMHILDINSSKLLRPSYLLNNALKTDFYTRLKHMQTFLNCHQDVFIDTLKNSCDIFIPLTALGFTRFSPSAVGAFGAISSIAALATIVKPLHKLASS